MAAIQRSPIAFHCKTPISAVRPSRPSPSIRLKPSPSLRLLRITAPIRRRRRGGGPTMMSSAASSYASALADLAKSNGTLDTTISDLEKIERVFSDAGALAFFTNPTIDVEKKRSVLDDIVKSSELQPHMSNFLNVLIDMNRIDQVKEIVKEFEVVYNKMTETELAVVTSVVPLESSHLAQIAKSVQRMTGAKNVRIKTAIEPSLIAGFTIRYGNSGSKLIDMSIKKQLDEIAGSLDFSEIALVG
ncbi:hypothetical protein QJS10_CPB18g01285 [Acorus calamus]|uniref:ATP synthase delta chain, chloroplastic n=1 Tax=Acorus calamus TaxID=4465 RepID=A0AAV9CSA9_ACOCL|nr:hypothetical protein QJS10_CPB18g01285 [Acorus calamus]